jgi:hypothetical protein
MHRYREILRIKDRVHVKSRRKAAQVCVQGKASSGVAARSAAAAPLFVHRRFGNAVLLNVELHDDGLQSREFLKVRRRKHRNRANALIWHYGEVSFEQLPARGAEIQAVGAQQDLGLGDLARVEAEDALSASGRYRAGNSKFARQNQSCPFVRTMASVISMMKTAAITAAN